MEDSDAPDTAAVVAPDGGLVATCATRVGSFVRLGDEVAQIHAGRSLVRLVLSDAEVSRTRLSVGDTLYLRWSVQPGRSVAARVQRIGASASRETVPDALTVVGGGEIYGTQAGESRTLADQSYLHVVVEPIYIPLERTAGLTARVCIPAQIETIGQWIYRQMTHFYNAWRMS